MEKIKVTKEEFIKIMENFTKKEERINQDKHKSIEEISQARENYDINGKIANGIGQDFETNCELWQINNNEQAKYIITNKVNNSKVGMLDYIILLNMKDKNLECFKISPTCNFSGEVMEITPNSPIGKAALNKKIGARINYSIDAEDYSYIILDKFSEEEFKKVDSLKTINIQDVIIKCKTLANKEILIYLGDNNIDNKKVVTTDNEFLIKLFSYIYIAKINDFGYNKYAPYETDLNYQKTLAKTKEI